MASIPLKTFCNQQLISFSTLSNWISNLNSMTFYISNQSPTLPIQSFFSHLWPPLSAISLSYSSWRCCNLCGIYSLHTLRASCHIAESYKHKTILIFYFSYKSVEYKGRVTTRLMILKMLNRTTQKSVLALEDQYTFVHNIYLYTL